MLSCDDFIQAFFAFTELVQLNSGFSCSVCTDKPKVVLADGTAHAFHRKHVTTELRPPNFVDYDDAAWPRIEGRMTSRSSQAFIPVSADRKIFQQHLDSTSDDPLPRGEDYKYLRPIVTLCLGQGLKSSSKPLRTLLLRFLIQVCNALL